MKAAQTLMNEHRVIERVLTALEIAAGRVKQGEEIRPAFFINAALFIKNYADGCHHHKEEGILFVAMNEAGMTSEGGPVGMMLAEHEQGREFTAAMKDAAEKWDKGDRSARGSVAHNALGYVSLLRLHIQKEDTILFPMAERAIPPKGQEKVDADFEHAGAEESATGVHDKYLALAETLEKESMKKIS